MYNFTGENLARQLWRCLCVEKRMCATAVKVAVVSVKRSIIQPGKLAMIRNQADIRPIVQNHSFDIAERFHVQQHINAWRGLRELSNRFRMESTSAAALIV
jgi:hypothetical protein